MYFGNTSQMQILHATIAHNSKERESITYFVRQINDRINDHLLSKNILNPRQPMGYKKLTWTINMAMWWNSPRPPCFTGTVMKNLVPSLEKTGSSFCKCEIMLASHAFLFTSQSLRRNLRFHVSLLSVVAMKTNGEIPSDLKHCSSCR